MTNLKIKKLQKTIFYILHLFFDMPLWIYLCISFVCGCMKDSTVYLTKEFTGKYTNLAFKEYIKPFEGFKKSPYLDKGVWRIGYGNKLDEEDTPLLEKAEIVVTISERIAQDTCKKELKKIYRELYYKLDLKHLSDYQIASLLSQIYNMGNRFYRTNTFKLLKELEKIEHKEKRKIQLYNIGKEIKRGYTKDSGLHRRRCAEATPFLI